MMATTETRQIPQVLIEREQWIIYRLEQRDGRRTKVPYQARNRAAKASSTDPRTWAPFDAVRKSERIGYVLTAADGVTFVDLDHCVDPETREIDGWAAQYVEEAATFTEYSQSGEGLHILAGGSLPGAGKHRKDESGNPVEMYDRERYVALTGDHVPGTPITIEPRQAFIDALYAQLADPPKRETPAHVPLACSDAEIVKRACENPTTGGEFTRLFAGDLGDVGGDASRGDWRLIRMLRFWTRADAGRMDAIYRSSGLGREKWGSRRGDSTYGARTIAAALDKGGPVYDTGRVIVDGIRRNGHTGAAVPGSEPVTLEHFSDVGVAAYVVARYGADLRYVPGQGFWAWDGRRWKRDADQVEAERIVHRAIRDLRQDAASESDPDRAKALFAYALKCEDNRRVLGIVRQARSHPAIAARLSDFDRDPLLLTCANGTINLATGELRPHSRADLITRQSPVKYNPDATAPLWETFLGRVLDGNTEIVDYMQRALGYSASGSVRERVVHFLYGPSGRNGKSTMLGTIQHLLGDYALAAAPNVLLETRRGDEHPTAIADLLGARFVAAVESGEGRKLDEVQVKRLAGNDRLKARYMARDYFEFDPTAKLWLATNHRPEIEGTDEAIWDRVRLVPFEVRIGDDEIDRNLGDKLIAEAPGILAWVVRGAMAWHRAGLCAPAEVVNAVARYRSLMDTLADFLADRCALHPTYSEAVASLYAAFRAWCEAVGVAPVSQRAFGLKLTERGFRADRDRGARLRFGLRLKTADDFEAEV